MFVAALLAICYPVQQLGGQGSGDLRSRPIKDRPPVVCALKNTTVRASIAGLGAAVTVTQTFTNPSRETIEAIYTFPLPHDAAVDRMRMTVGSQVIEGRIKRREVARRIYEAAKNAGQTAALLDQERPNIFTQSVANITPGSQVQVEISYVQLLKYEKGKVEFSYPMVVGPRFLGNATDPQKIDPPRVAPGTRSGADIQVAVAIDPATPVRQLHSALHDVVTDTGEAGTLIRLARKNEIPNRDFILTYEMATSAVSSTFASTFVPGQGGSFSLVLMPPKVPKADQIAPREVVFVMDQSGSQGGLPINKSKELTLKMMATLRPGDTFNVFGFNNTVQSVFERPQPATAASIAKASAFVKQMRADGGTQLLEGLNAALKFPKDPRRLRIVLFNTDGYVGDEPQILEAIQKNRDSTRIFTFGIGNGVNRYLVESMSREGRGACEIVTLNAEADQAVKRFIERAYSPVLTDIKVTAPGTTDLTPSALPDVFNDRPIIVFGRYQKAGPTTITVSGRVGGEPWSQRLNVDLSATEGSRSISSLWARSRIEDLQSEGYVQMILRNSEDATVSAITDIALDYGLMSQYTSFVAVSPRVVNVGGRQVTIHVPVERADGLTVEQGGNRDMDGSFSSRGRQVFAGGAAAGGMAGKAVSQNQSRAKSLPSEFEAKSERAQSSKKDRFTMIVARKLRTARGVVSVMIWSSAVDAAALAKLREAGVDVGEVLPGLKLVLGRCQAADLRKVAALGLVEAVDPLE
jgi:Ca-activated chloride channel family protein